jgi:cytochrome P450
VIPQMSAIMLDEQIFPHAHVFDPERYIRDSSLAEKVLPFSIGKRQCMGESVARMQLFMIFVTLMQQFRFTLNNPNAKDYTNIRAGFVNHPQEYECIINII